MAGLRKHSLHAEIELNPATAAARGIKNGDWVDVRTPAGGMRARACFNEKIDPRVLLSASTAGGRGAMNWEPVPPILSIRTARTST
jgi:anaerobic selenocysteine-containing dehydrogenase